MHRSRRGAKPGQSQNPGLLESGILEGRGAYGELTECHCLWLHCQHSMFPVGLPLASLQQLPSIWCWLSVPGKPPFWGCTGQDGAVQVGEVRGREGSLSKSPAILPWSGDAGQRWGETPPRYLRSCHMHQSLHSASTTVCARVLLDISVQLRCVRALW